MPPKSLFTCFLTISIFISSVLYQATAAPGRGSADELSVKQHRPKKYQTKEKRFTFYWQDILSGTNPTAIPIIKPINSNPFYFGGVTMIDDPITLTPELNSTLLGRAQGFYAGASQRDELAFLMVMNFYFVTGKYNGSTLSIMGRNPAMHTLREMSVTGGTGLFRFARGYVQAHSVKLNFTTGDATVRYNVHVQL